MERHELEFDVLTDANSDDARELESAYTLPEEVRPVYAGIGINSEKHNGHGQFDLRPAATFVVDTDGTITSAMVAADFMQRAEPAEVVANLESVVV